MHCLGDQCQWHAQFQCIQCSPPAGTLLPGTVEYPPHAQLTIRITNTQDPRSDIDEVGRKHPFVPTVEGIRDFFLGQLQRLIHQRPGLGDQLHITVLDPVMHHLDVMPGTALAHPAATGLAILRARGNRLEDLLDHGPGVGIASRHEGRPVPGTLLAAGYPHAEKTYSPPAQLRITSLGIPVEGIAPVHDYVPRLEMWQQAGDDLVHHGAGGNHEQDDARGLQLGTEAGIIVAGLEAVPVLHLLHESLGTGSGVIENCNAKRVITKIERDIAAHHAQTDHPDIR